MPRRELGLFLAARLLGTVGMQIQSVAIGWQVYARTRDPLSLAWVGLAQFVPLVLASPYAGTVVDRYDRQRIVAISHTVYAIGAAALVGLTLSPGAQLWPVYAVLALLGATRAFAAPGTWALLPWLVPDDQLPRAIPLSSSTFQLATLAGPAVGGALIAWGDAELAYGASSLSNLACVLLVLLLRPNRPDRKHSPESGWRRVIGGLTYLRSQRALLGAISLDLFAVLLGGAVALMPIYAQDILEVGAAGFGLMRSAPAAGALAAALTLAIFPLRRRAGPAMFLGVAGFGVATCVFALSENFILTLAALAFLGASDMVSVVVRQSIVQLWTPDELRGRVASLNMIFIGGSNELGEFESGLTARWFGAVRAALLGGIGTLVVTGLWAWWFPELRTLDSLDRDRSLPDRGEEV